MITQAAQLVPGCSPAQAPFWSPCMCGLCRQPSRCPGPATWPCSHQGLPVCECPGPQQGGQGKEKRRVLLPSLYLNLPIQNSSLSGKVQLPRQSCPFPRLDWQVSTSLCHCVLEGSRRAPHQPPACFLQGLLQGSLPQVFPVTPPSLRGLGRHWYQAGTMC